METDYRYSSWPSNVQELLRPTFPGVIRQIRKNFHNLVRAQLINQTPVNPNRSETFLMNANTHLLQVIILDPTQENTVELLSVAEMFYANNIPLRLVFLSSRCIHFLDIFLGINYQLL